MWRNPSDLETEKPMHTLDTDRKFHDSSKSPTQEKHASVEVTPLRDGCFQVLAEQSTKKWDGKKWHTDMVTLTLTEDQVAKLREALA